MQFSKNEAENVKSAWWKLEDRAESGMNGMIAAWNKEEKCVSSSTWGYTSAVIIVTFWMERDKAYIQFLLLFSYSAYPLELDFVL